MTPQDLIDRSIGGYRIVELVGEGEVAWVFKGENAFSPKMAPRALKVLKPEFCADEVFAKRFIKESSFLEQLRHPNIVRFYGIRHEDGLLMMELELLAGETLAQRLAARGSLPVSKVTRWMQAAAEAVAGAHALGIVHRDLKPSNLFLTHADAVKVLDFGIARAMEEAHRLTQTRAKPRRSAYIPPEIILGDSWTVRADVYALGLITYELLLGRYPYPLDKADFSDEYAVMNAVARGSPSPLAAERSDVPAGLAQLVEQCISKLPHERPSSAHAFGRELSSFFRSDDDSDIGGGTRISGLSNIFGFRKR